MGEESVVVVAEGVAEADANETTEEDVIELELELVDEAEVVESVEVDMISVFGHMDQ